MPAARALTASQSDWLRVRSYLQEHRHALALDAAGDYPADRKIAGTPLLAAPGWQPAEPVPLPDIALEFPASAGPQPGPDPDPAPGDGAAPLLPERPDGTRYLRYSDALRELAAPAVFENRPTYRLTEADLTPGASRLAFTRGRYFDGVDTGEAAAHEYAAARLGGSSHHGPAGLRALIADPCDLRRRPANLAISTLTLRLEAATGRASFLLHWRDPAKVGHAGGMYQVIPVGVFQPAGEAGWHERGDFSLWRCMIREFDEELRGRSEDYGPGPVDYDSWPFARQMAAALDRGQIRVWCVGLGVDPLTYATDLLTVAVIDSRVFDGLFSLSPRRNAEGSVLAAREFAPHVIDRIVTSEPVQAAGAAVLRLAWRHRDTLTCLRHPWIHACSAVCGAGMQSSLEHRVSSDGEMVVGTENLNVGHHVVQFYGHDEELAERVAGYLLGALEGGGVAIVIATPEHRHEFGTRLAQAGADLAAASDRGAYLVLDASETLRELMAADGLDGAAFDRVIGTLIRRAGAGGRPVRAYGELVALLWDDGLVSAAAQLEGMWDELGRRHPFSLFCGYRAGAVTREIDAFAEVCRLHAEVIGSPAAAGPAGPAAVRTFAFSRDAPAAARHYTVATLREWGAGDVTDDAALTVTELAANAIVHAQSAFTITLSAHDDLLRISVRDASPLRGAELRPAPLHGLGAVDALASRWGVESLGSAGKTVWVDLRG